MAAGKMLQHERDALLRAQRRDTAEWERHVDERPEFGYDPRLVERAEPLRKRLRRSPGAF